VIFLRQPDFGSFTIGLMMMGFMAFLSSFPRKAFLTITSIAFFSVIGFLFMAPYRVHRILSYLDPWKDPKNTGFQIIQSYIAFAQGGLWGKGLGNGHQKLFFLPEAHNDFILSVIGEELGFSGIVFMVLLFLALFTLGMIFSLHMSSRMHSMLLAGLSFMIGLQSFLNMGVVVGLLPTKGLNLPFISYGGSSLLGHAMAIGVIFSLLRFEFFKKNEENQTENLQEA
jgi:cell division protein FtsW